MKTHAEIHDAIEVVQSEMVLSMAEEHFIHILHALNDRISSHNDAALVLMLGFNKRLEALEDRIKDLDGSVTAAFNAIQELDDLKAPR